MKVLALEKKYQLFINNEWVTPSSKKYFPTINPATEDVLAEIAWANDADVDKAVKAARKAYTDVWSKISGAERGKYIYRIARMMQERAREFAVIETLDSGKPIRESRDVDVPLACNHFFYYAGWADKLEYAVPHKKPEALGVAGQIIPWNFPLLMAAWKIAPALAAGNTVVLKPAETTSLTALKLAEIIKDSGLPAGVVNIVTGYGDTGAAIVNHPDIDKIAFTGSTNVGKIIQRAVAGTHKRTTLDLGGKSANIIFDDAPIDQAVEGIINGIFFLATLTLGDLVYDLFALHYPGNPKFQIWQPLSHMFMHGDISHIFFNMFGLYMFGTPLEQMWGKQKFIFFYLSTGLGAAGLQLLLYYYQVGQVSDALTEAKVPSCMRSQVWVLARDQAVAGAVYWIPHIRLSRVAAIQIGDKQLSRCFMH